MNKDERRVILMYVIKNKAKFIRGIIVIFIAVIFIVYMLTSIVSGVVSIFTKKEDKQEQQAKDQQTQIQEPQTNTIDEPQVAQTVANTVPEVLNEWNLKLVNKDNSVERTYVPELEELDDGVMFDKRALPYLKKMINAMYNDKLTGFWVQSAYRSYDKQEELFNNKVNSYKNQGKSQEEAERLAQQVVQRPEMSEHNLGLAADFNKVTNEFEQTKAFTWLQKNAANYGFILRYPKDKQEITGITYESWHWRYVGEEHAKVMKEKGYCLEEYVEYLKGAESV